ncbi:MAG TPA: tripartite tricarboxylate transporter substrate-binding protein [Beijerinckiaceae bacterium]|jgi:tripartite-type tricarboxylate transporter receptor subunit TctC|nr:tripartite tricarboxylate transporter substrate-binding protein [Beijerinckiaceae bacterium]
MKRLYSLAVASLFGLTAFAGSVAAQSVADFYHGKTVTVGIGYGVGGSDDLWARFVAKYLPDHLAGHPNVVPVNVPGAAGLVLANQIGNTQPKDGTYFGLINRGIPFEPLLGGPGIHFDPQQMSWIGSPDRDTPVCAVNTDAPVQSLDELATKELIVGSTGSGADTQVYPEFLDNMLGLKMKIVSGYPGSREVVLAMQRGEVQGICVSYDTVARDAYFRSGKMKILFQMALKPDPRIADIPLGSALAKTDDDRLALQLFLTRIAVGRPFVAPPGVPADRLAALREAFKDTIADPQLAADAAKAGLHPQYVSGQEISDILAQTYKTPANIVALTKKALGRN